MTVKVLGRKIFFHHLYCSMQPGVVFFFFRAEVFVVLYSRLPGCPAHAAKNNCVTAFLGHVLLGNNIKK